MAFLSLVPLLLLLLGGTSAVEDNLELKSSVNVVVGPPALKRSSRGYDHIDALFGTRTTPGRIRAPLVYAQGNRLCPGNKELDGVALPTTPFIFFTDRAGCGFFQKVLRAQTYGAAAVVFADTQCVCSRKAEGLCESARCISEPVLADPHPEFGRNFTIPSLLLFKEDADPIREALLNTNNNGQPQNIVMVLNYQKPQQQQAQQQQQQPPPAAAASKPAAAATATQTAVAAPPPPSVHYDLWTTPTDALTKKLHVPLFQTTLALQDARATFEPHQFIFDGIAAGCRGSSGAEVGGESCREACTNNGRYCAAAGVVNNAGGVLGSDIVTESLRRICLWEIYGNTKQQQAPPAAGSPTTVGLEWWKYVEAFAKTCEDPSTIQTSFSQPTCIYAALQAAGADISVVDQCMEDAGGVEGDNPNTLLDRSMAVQRQTGIVSLPTVLVNGERVKAYMGFGSFRAICEGYGDQPPPICKECMGCGPLAQCVRQGTCPNNALQKQAQATQIDQANKAEEQAEVQEEHQEQENVVQDMEEMDGMDADEEGEEEEGP